MNMVMPDIMSNTQLAPYLPSMIVQVLGIEKHVLTNHDEYIVVWGESRETIMWITYPTFHSEKNIMSGTPIIGELFGQKYIWSCITARTTNKSDGYNYAFVNPRFGYTTRPVDYKSILKHYISLRNFDKITIINSCTVVSLVEGKR
jgi:hypothetical protein